MAGACPCRLAGEGGAPGAQGAAGGEAGRHGAPGDLLVLLLWVGGAEARDRWQPHRAVRGVAGAHGDVSKQPV